MKKIILKKTVVANLSKDGMNNLRGGDSEYTDCGSGSGVSCGCPVPTKDIACYLSKNGGATCVTNTFIATCVKCV